MNNYFFLTIIFFALPLMCMEDLQLITRSSSETELIKSLGDDAQGNVISVTRNALYDCGREYLNPRTDLGSELTQPFSSLDVIRKGKIFRKKDYSRKPYVSGNNTTVATYLPEQLYWIEFYEEDHYHEVAMFDGLITQLCMDTKGDLAAVVESASNSTYLLKIIKLPTHKKKLMLCEILRNWFWLDKPQYKLILQTTESISSLALNHNNTMLAFTQKNNLNVWNLQEKKFIHQDILIHQKRILNTIFTQDDDYIISSAGSIITMTDVHSGLTKQLLGNEFPVYQLQVGNSAYGPIVAALCKKNYSSNSQKETEVCVWAQPMHQIKSKLFHMLQTKKNTSVNFSSN